MMERQFYKVVEVAEILDVSAATIYRAVERKEIPSMRVAGSVRVPKKWVDQLLSGQIA
ncbi:MAG: DNA-binding protein [Sulfobacillus acidophilus]|uniref:DNA-binding protein n=1 Tax=Sulfobacillus acidophilus TaxID=53633 RepID=A0A2T2WJ89_9FIRM|nr:MAG: DNA-binding protein [Sulfobacillus acidophilus]